MLRYRYGFIQTVVKIIKRGDIRCSVDGGEVGDSLGYFLIVWASKEAVLGGRRCLCLKLG